MTGDGDPLFIQAKEARRSVPESCSGKSIYPNHGQRVVNRYRLMQPFSDPFLGWTVGKEGKHFFFRQLRDIKISLKVETFGKSEMLTYADQNEKDHPSFMKAIKSGKIEAEFEE